VDKRNFIAFLILSMAVLVASSLLFPPPERPQEVPAPADAEQQPGAPPADDADGAPQPEQGVPELAIPVEADGPLEYLTLGSLDRETGYRMLVTFTNRGAAVHRAEMTSPRFRDLHDRSGYLGHLEFEDTPAGPKVRVVGPGTPADKAGIKVGDVVTGIQPVRGDMVAVRTAEEFHAVRSKTSPRQEIMLQVIRDGGAPQTVAVKLVRRPLEVMRPEIENIRMRDGTVPEGFVDPPSFLMTIANIGGRPLGEATTKRMEAWLSEGNWAVATRDQRSITFERLLPAQKLALVKRFTLEPVPAGSRDNENYPGYHVQLEIEVRNASDSPQMVAYRLDGPTGLPLEGWWYAHKISRHRWLGGAGLRDVVARFQGRAVQQFDCMTIADDKAEPMGHDQSLAYVGVDAVYFSSVLIPDKRSLDEDWFDITEAVRVGPKPDARTPFTYTNVTCRLTRDPVELAAGGSQRDSYRVFIGPKRPELLAQYQAANDPNYSLRDLIYFGWFGSVARAMLWVLHWFYSFVGNYGIAIVMLTVLVRGAMFPISFKQTQNMARMQALKPELDRISDKYKGDMQKRSQAMQELYRKHQINPLGGCLPLFLQLPIFIGLYRALMIDIELRQTPLFSEMIRWCSDLSAPDMFYDWSWFMPRMVNDGIGILGLGPYFNVLPIVTIALFLVSMKMSMPEPTNEQAVLQQKMMKYMTVFMGLLFYKVASGLCIYFIASSIWGIGERKMLTRAKGDADSLSAKPVGPPARDVAPAGDGRNGSTGRKKGPKAKRKR